MDLTPRPGWSVDWAIDDRYQLAPSGSDIHLRYTDLTANAHAYTAEAWVSAVAPTHQFNAYEEVWIPCVMVRCQLGANGRSPLQSTFVGVIEPYEGRSNIAHIRVYP